jgi:S1-C subfamily serine protease
VHSWEGFRAKTNIFTGSSEIAVIKRAMSVSSKQFAICAGLLLLGSGAGLVANAYLNSTNSVAPSERAATPSPIAYREAQTEPQAEVSSRPNPNFIAAAVERVGSAVVRIDASRTITEQFPDALRNPFFKRFFGDESPSQEHVEQGTGSGFIITSDGRVITNAHVVEGADKVTVTLKDGRTFEGKVVGIDPITDVAAVKIESTDLPVVPLGNSEDLMPGQWAIAIGNPLGLDNTVTAGIISAIGRSSSQVGIPDRRVQFIQTDAAINPGNSGGPLLNDQGEVIGINTAIRANAQGLGFAIPIATGQRIADQLFSKGKAEHPYLGIQMVDLTSEVRDQINQDPEAGIKVTANRGVLVVEVMPGTPAAAAGLRSGDIIVKVNETVVDTASDVQSQVEATQVGAIISVEVQRENRSQVFQVRPSAFPAEEAG